MPLVEIGMVIAGLVALYLGAEGLVRGASSAALRLGITPLVIGLTVVAFGTSAPELLVGLLGTDDIAVGNIIGSNVANLALILGAASMIRPIEVKARAVRRDMPVMVAATILFIILAIDGTITRVNGAILLGAMALYLSYTFVEARRDIANFQDLLGDEVDPEVTERRHWGADAAFVVAGIVGLALGAKWMVDGSIVIADFFGISELVIAITVVALGTSLPELATSLVAAYRDEVDISVGNVIGSNIFNLLLVIGVVASLESLHVGRDALSIDLWVMLAVSIGIWPLLRTGHVLDRREGGLLLALYVGYVVSLFLR